MEKIFVYNADWQTPAKTEQFVYEYIKNQNEIIDGVVYVAFPWANLFDGLARKTSLGDRLYSEFKKLVPLVSAEKGKKIVTACQHIKFKDYHHIFNEIGITDLFTSHKEIKQTNLGGINLYPLQLFPVQASNELVKQLAEDSVKDSWDDRAFLFSFVGAYDSRYYLTESRANIFKHLKSAGGLVTERLSWHYQARVYDEQVYGKVLTNDYLTEEEKNSAEYIQVMLNTKFSLCPSGTGPNSIRLWESIEFDAIPVILADTLDLAGDKALWQKACVFVEETEENIKNLPKLLESLSNNKEVIDNKLCALKELKSSLGLNSFAKHVIDTAKVISKLNSSKKTFVLNCEKLTKSQLSAWERFLNSANILAGFDFKIVYKNQVFDEKSSEHIKSELTCLDALDFSRNFAFIFNSKTLTPALMNKFDVIYIESNEEPEYVNNLLYPLLKFCDNIGFDTLKPWTPICTLITSMFNGDEYKTEFLENTGSLTKLNDIEIQVFRPASRGKEHFDLINFGRRNGSLIYLWLAKDPGLYDVWNLGVKMSTAKYCSNANIDDKRGPDHVVELVAALNSNDECVVGSTALRVTDTKGQNWDASSNEIVWYKPGKPEVYGIEKLSKYDETLARMKSHNIPHCMPVWRTSLHREHGYFSEKDFGPSSDWEFWLRCGFENKKFFLLNKDLGLYYRAPQSYWRRDPNAKNFDEAIVSEYFIGSQLREKPLSHGLKSKRFSVMIVAFSKDDYWIGLNCLYKALQANIAKSSIEKKLVKLICERFLAIDSDYLASATARLAPVAEIKNTFFDFFGFYLRGLSTELMAEPLLHSLLDLADKIISADDPLLGWISKAKTYHIVGCSEKEAICLAEAYRIDSYKFWSNVNRFYGLQKDLNHFISLLSKHHDIPKVSDFSWLTPGSTLYFLPDYSHGNPYQKLLYQNFSSLKVDIVGLSETESINLDITRFKSGDVLHVHWINILFRNQTIDSIASCLNDFLAKLTKLKDQGVKIVWTVHNRQNHETLDLAIEYKFRNELSALCDVVLLHHPMIQTEISNWLARTAKVEIVEHGLYDNYYPNTISKNEARSFLNLEQDRLTIATLGLIREYKDLPEKISALRTANNKLSRPHHYIVAGKISCRKTMDEISKSGTRNVSDFNRFIPDDEVQNYLNAADYILLSYKDILTSGSFFQAMTFNKMVLSPAKGSLNYYVADGVNGFLYSDVSQIQFVVENLGIIDFCIEKHQSFWPLAII